SDIHCRLIHIALSECHDDIFKHYTALSYVWGDASQTKAVFINSLPFEITSNLFDALHEIRPEEQSLRLWADAICIDQLNFKERSSQVGLMREIYSYAAFTVIYLGRSNIECDWAFAAVRDSCYQLNRRFLDVISTQILSRPWFSRVWTFQELVLSR
ncbi:heterokaryon incompatibility, partial [Rhexocercosporidium sp. MPI-PUGE-AT-0058]